MPSGYRISLWSEKERHEKGLTELQMLKLKAPGLHKEYFEEKWYQIVKDHVWKQKARRLLEKIENE